MTLSERIEARKREEMHKMHPRCICFNFDGEHSRKCPEYRAPWTQRDNKKVLGF